MDTLAQYKNGNTVVSILEDGTKERVSPDDSWACPERPESIDLKVTNRCGRACGYCHEQSVPTGKHAAWEDVAFILGGMLPGSEVAIGGGDPLSWPHIFRLLEHTTVLRLIPNMTISLPAPYLLPNLKKDLDFWRSNRRLYGLGISVQSSLSSLPHAAEMGITDKNTVLHYILGVDKVRDVLEVPRLGLDRILLLGYKRVGRGHAWGAAHERQIQENIQEWEQNLNALQDSFCVVAFDNLALQQLSVMEKMTKGEWAGSYMGDEGEFTMYVDAVEKTFAPSSTSIERFPWKNLTLKEMFFFCREQSRNSSILERS